MPNRCSAQYVGDKCALHPSNPKHFCVAVIRYFTNGAGWNGFNTADIHSVSFVGGRFLIRTETTKAMEAIEAMEPMEAMP
jgi:hypothetical protein